MSERGTALIETIVAGFLVLVVVLPLASVIVRIADAQGTAAASAHDAASWVARHGATGGARWDRGGLDIDIVGDEVVAVATVDVSVLSILGMDMSITVRERATVVISPYRSGP